MTKCQSVSAFLAHLPAKIHLAYLLLEQYMQTGERFPKISRFNFINISKTMKVKPLSDRVLIQPNPAEEKTAGGLIIPDTAKEKPLAGKVIAVGPGTSEVKMEVKVGDEVLYGKYAGQEISIDGTDYLIMKQNDILAII